MPLPTISSRRPLQALTPVTLVPEWVSQRGQVSAALKGIECIAIRSVTNRKGIHYYVIEIYEYTTKNRIPTNRPRQHPPLSPTAASTSPSSHGGSAPRCSRKPDARMERRFAEFADLRGKVYNHAHLAHKMVPCEFCKEVINEIVWGDNQPGSFLKLIAAEQKVMQMLAKSVNSLLELVKSNGDGRLCGGQDNIPQVLYEFLFSQECSIR